MGYEYHPSEVLEVIDESDVVKRYVIKVNKDFPFSFKSGQFVMLDLPIDSKVTNRSYSIASAPSDDNTFELVIVLKEDGLGTPYLFKNIFKGSQLMVSRAIGKFGLPEMLEDDICFICTGTGIAPFRSMLIDIMNKNIPHKNIYMVFGNRWKKDVLYHQEMLDLEQKVPGFKFIPVLSRETTETWNGKTGYVHQVYEDLFADKRPGWFYICGWADMLKETRQRLEDMGYDRKRIKFESYD